MSRASCGDAAIALERNYVNLEARIPLTDGSDYGNLVVPNGNQQEAIHRWFHLKEAFSSRLFLRVLKDTGLNAKQGLRVLDPFCGVGTTAVSVADATASREIAHPSVYGIECNPFLHLVASTKLAALQCPPPGFTAFAKRVAELALSRCDAAPSMPALSTFHKSAFFDPSDVDQLMRIRWAIDEAEADGADNIQVPLARICLGAIVEVVSNLRRDGRALRFTEKRSRPPTLEAFLGKARQIEDDLPKSAVAVRGRILLGDGRLMQGIDRRFQPFDLIFFSPPYPNNIDYTEVYKLENWLLGYINDHRAFLGQRMRTVYSHPSVLRPDPLPCEDLSRAENAALVAIVQPLLEAIPADRYTEGRRRMLSGYLLDMYKTLRAARARLASDGRVVYVVGNSVHGQGASQLIIAADLLIAQLGDVAGLAVERLAVARHLRRRFVTSPHLRESVVFLRHA